MSLAGPQDLNTLMLQKARQALDDDTALRDMPSNDLVALCQRLAADLIESEEARLRTTAAEPVENVDKMAALVMFAGGIAHDFNNILGIILNRATLALVDQYSDPIQCEHMKQIIRATDRGKELIKQITSFSRPGSASLSPLVLGPILEDTASFLTATLPANISVRLETPPVPVLVLGDPTQISQIAMNLATNAAAAMPGGGILTVHLGVDAAKDQVILVVEDTGEGMSAEVLSRIFEPYFSTRIGGRGTGLGLAVVHSIVKRHAGTIRCESWPGSGTRFSIRLPLHHGHAEVTPQVQPERRLPKCMLPHVPHAVRRILFVDDEEELARSSHKLLQSFGYQPTVFTNPIQALAAYAADPQGFDIVITDMLMPEMNGQELAREILALSPGLPIIMCTGYSETFSREQALEQGVRGYVPKPIDWLELDTLIAALTAVGEPL